MQVDIHKILHSVLAKFSGSRWGKNCLGKIISEEQAQECSYHHGGWDGTHLFRIRFDQLLQYLQFLGK